MKIFKNGDRYISRIEFCCGEISKDILLGRIVTKQWTDHALGFWIGDFRISHCPHCGAEINGDAHPEPCQQREIL